MNRSSPPSLPLRFFRWFCHPDYREDIEGDLIERYLKTLELKGYQNAKRQFIWDVIRLFRPGIIRSMEGNQKLNSFGMLKTHFKVSVRNLIHYKSYSAINLLGFVLGLGIAISLFWIVRFERSFDNYHTDSDRIYQIMGMEDGQNGSQIPSGVIYTLNTQFPEVETAVSVHGYNPQVIEVSGQKFKMRNSYFVHPEVLEILDISWIAGSPETVFRTPDEVIIDKPTAERLFKLEDPIGQTINFDNEFTLTVAGIIEKVPANTEFPFEMIIPISRHPWKNDLRNDHWGGGDSSFKGLVKIKEGSDKSSIEERITNIARVQKNFDYDSLSFVPINAVHHNPYNDPFNYYSPEWLLDWLIYIAVFLLLIACVNFINLSTTHTIVRRKGIAIRKILGSNRWGLLTQFIVETGVLVLISIVFSAILAATIISYSNQFFHTNIPVASLTSIDFLILCASLWSLITIIAGIYPAISITNFRVLAAFQKSVASGKRSPIAIRQVLIAFQFVIAQVLIVGILIGTKQMDYLFSKDLGINHENVLMVNIPEPDNTLKRERFRQQLSLHPAVKGISYGLSTPSASHSSWWAEFQNSRFEDRLLARIQFIDEKYLDFFGMKLLAGRKIQPTDTAINGALVNEMVSKAMGFNSPEEAIGQSVKGWPGTFRIIGVVANYHSESLKENIIPHVFAYRPNRFFTANIRIGTENEAEALAAIEKYWKDLYPDNYFEYDYLSDALNKYYESDQKFTNFLGLFAAVSILICCLGLYGLIYFVCIRKTKEIGIRKVLGAKIESVIATLSRGFLKPILISLVVCIPVIWNLQRSYLSNYTFSIEFNWNIYILAALITVIIASIPVFLQARHSAMKNPVDCLRDE